MSYILDALRRADAERRRGQAPALQQVAAPPDAPPRDRRRAAPRSAWAAAALVALGLAAAAAWWWITRGHALPTPVPAEAPPAVGKMTPAPPAPPVAPVAPAAGPVTIPTIVRAPSPSPPPAPAPAPPPAPAAAPPAAVSVTPPRPIAASALPEPRRSEVMQLPVGGVVHSQDRRQSFVMVGSQIVREGDSLAPGIVVDRIGAHTLWLRVDEQVVELPL